MLMRGLEPFEFHGVNFRQFPAESDGQVVADCPLCGKTRHFYIQPDEQLWNCKKCGKGGNLQGFLRALYERSARLTTIQDYQRLASIRWNVANALEYKRAGFAWDKEQQRWLLISRDYDGNIVSLQTWRESGGQIGGKSQPFISTKGVPNGLWGAEQLKGNSGKRVWICEGAWDGVAMRSMAKSEPVTAVPGAAIFKREWLPWFNDRAVVMAYDADKAGDEGMTGKGSLLKPHTAKLAYIRWPLDLPDGYDVSDLVREKGREEAWATLQKLIAPAPRTVSLVKPKLVSKTSNNGEGPKRSGLKQKQKTTFKSVLDVYKRWLDMSDDAIKALRILLAIVLSNQISGDPLWLYLVAPPGSGKTALLNPLRSITEHCVFRSNLTTHMLVSGFQATNDPSLIPKLNGMTLVLKDMTELLVAPQHVQDEVFGTLRGAYDGTVDRSYGNQVHRVYESHFSLIAGVTVQIHGHHQANMGERLLKFQMVRSQSEQETLIRRAMQNLGREERLEEELAEITRAFLDRKVNPDTLTKRMPEWAYDRILALSQLIARLRTEVERDYRGDQVKYRPQDEVGSRLAKQLLKLGMLLTESNDDGNKFGEDEWKIVERVAFDTAIGWNLDVVQAIMIYGNGRMSKAELVQASNLPPTNVARRLEDLMILGVLKKHAADDRFKTPCYELVADIQKLWRRAMVQEDHIKTVSLIRKFRKYKLKPRAS